MMKLTQVCEQIYKTVHPDQLNINYELKKKEYSEVRKYSLKEIGDNHKALKAGQSVEQIKQPTMFQKATKFIGRMMFVLLILRLVVPAPYQLMVKKQLT